VRAAITYFRGLAGAFRTHGPVFLLFFCANNPFIGVGLGLALRLLVRRGPSPSTVALAVICLFLIQQGVVWIAGAAGSGSIKRDALNLALRLAEHSKVQLADSADVERLIPAAARVHTTNVVVWEPKSPNSLRLASPHFFASFGGEPSLAFVRKSTVERAQPETAAFWFHELGHAAPTSRFRHFEKYIGALGSLVAIALAVVHSLGSGLPEVLAAVAIPLFVFLRAVHVSSSVRLKSECAADTFALVQVWRLGLDLERSAGALALVARHEAAPMAEREARVLHITETTSTLRTVASGALPVYPAVSRPSRVLEVVLGLLLVFAGASLRVSWFSSLATAALAIALVPLALAASLVLRATERSLIALLRRLT
jgi:hypothetical protein